MLDLEIELQVYINRCATLQVTKALVFPSNFAKCLPRHECKLPDLQHCYTDYENHTYNHKTKLQQV